MKLNYRTNNNCGLKLKILIYLHRVQLFFFLYFFLIAVLDYTVVTVEKYFIENFLILCGIKFLNDIIFVELT